MAFFQEDNPFGASLPTLRGPSTNEFGKPKTDREILEEEIAKGKARRTLFDKLAGAFIGAGNPSQAGGPDYLASRVAASQADAQRQRQRLQLQRETITEVVKNLPSGDKRLPGLISRGEQLGLDGRMLRAAAGTNPPASPFAGVSRGASIIDKRTGKIVDTAPSPAQPRQLTRDEAQFNKLESIIKKAHRLAGEGKRLSSGEIEAGTALAQHLQVNADLDPLTTRENAEAEARAEEEDSDGEGWFWRNILNPTERGLEANAAPLGEAGRKVASFVASTPWGQKAVQWVRDNITGSGNERTEAERLIEQAEKAKAQGAPAERVEAALAAELKKLKVKSDKGG